MVININNISQEKACLPLLPKWEQVERFLIVLKEPGFITDFISSSGDPNWQALLAFLRYVPRKDDENAQNLVQCFRDSFLFETDSWIEACLYALDWETPYNELPILPEWMIDQIPLIEEFATDYLINNYWIVRDDDTFYVFAMPKDQ